MLLLSRKLGTLFCLLVYLRTNLAAQITCHKELYGSPRAADCDSLLKSFAYLNDDQPRIFDEEQLRVPDGLWFPGVENDYQTHVMQLPAYWSLRTCNIAILSYAEAPTLRIPLGISTFKEVRSKGDDLLNRCIYMRAQEGGSVVVPSFSGRNPVLSLFMWETGSDFDFLCNELQNDPASITPSHMSLMAAMNGTSARNATLSRIAASRPVSKAEASAKIQALRKGRATS